MNKSEIKACLNCKAQECDGNYPYCSGGKKRQYKRTKLRALGKGNATVLVSMLIKMGYPVKEIAKICDTSIYSIASLIKVALRKSLVTEEQVEAIRIYKKHKPSPAK